MRLTPAIYFAQSYFSPSAASSLWWLPLSPTYGPLLVWRGFRSGLSAGAGADHFASVLQKRSMRSRPFWMLAMLVA